MQEIISILLSVHRLFGTPMTSNLVFHDRIKAVTGLWLLARFLSELFLRTFPMRNCSNFPIRLSVGEELSYSFGLSGAENSRFTKLSFSLCTLFCENVTKALFFVPNLACSCDRVAFCRSFAGLHFWHDTLFIFSSPWG